MNELFAAAGYYKSMMDMFFCTWMPLYSTLKVKPVDLLGKNAIVTGANIGIGLETARKLAQFGASVTLVCRDAQKGEAARQDIMKTTGSKSVEVRILDFSSFSSVRAFVEGWGDKPIDILVNNAGMTQSRFVKCEGGFESTYTVNFLTHFLLTMLLLPLMASGARITNVSSVGHYAGVRRHFLADDFDSSKYLVAEGHEEGGILKPGFKFDIYGKAKLAQVMFTRELQHRLDASPVYASRNITVTSLHPGMVKSAIWERHVGVASEVTKQIEAEMVMVNKYGIDTEQGACTPVWLVTTTDRIKGGLYYDRMHVRLNNALVEDEALRKEVWDTWVVTCGVPDLVPARAPDHFM